VTTNCCAAAAASPAAAAVRVQTYTQRQAKQSLVSIASTSAAAAQVDEGAWGSVEPDGVEEVPKKRKGILGLLGLLGVLGVVGIIPAGMPVCRGGGWGQMYWDDGG
jgi:hypothetical protein